jgi:Na+/H+ antiporter NhaA
VSEQSVVIRESLRGLREFLATEVGGTSVLLGGTLAGLIWRNAPFGDTYQRFWHTKLAISYNGSEFSLDLLHWVNDGLMTLFFFVIGLEISREVVVGQLRDRRIIAVPAAAALGGMAVPALIFTALNAGGPGAAGWGIPMASDTAFVLGLLAVVGARCAEPLRAFLLTLAVVDDIGAILVVAFFYTSDFRWPALAVAIGLFGLVLLARRVRLGKAPVYLLLGLGMWAATLESGVHPTLVGIALGVLVNVYAPNDLKILRAGELVHALGNDPSPELARQASLSVRRVVSINERLQHLLHPWTSYLVVPLFALANAGVSLSPGNLRHALTSPLSIGIVVALVVGKFVGITIGSWLPLRLDIGDLPGNLVWGQLFGGAAVAGIGFTVSLFITELAFHDSVHQADAKIGIIAGSLLAAGLGWLIFRLAWDRGAVCAPPEAPDEPPPYDGPLLDPVSARDHVRGPADAPVTLIEYGDYECPFCGKAHPLLAELQQQYGPQLRVVFRHYPLREIHPHAVPAALVAEAAADAGRFWEMHDMLFANQRALTDLDLADYAAQLHVEPWEDINRHRDRVQEDVESGFRNGVRGTPSFFVNGIRYQGPLSLTGFITAIDRALASVQSGK